MLIYISGAISSDPDYRVKFLKKQMELEEKGHKVINPSRIGDMLPELKHEQYLHIDKALIDICDAVYFLKDWGLSKGAREEYEYVKDINHTIKKYCTMRENNDGWVAIYEYEDKILARKGEPIKLIFEGDNEDEL